MENTDCNDRVKECSGECKGCPCNVVYDMKDNYCWKFKKPIDKEVMRDGKTNILKKEREEE